MRLFPLTFLCLALVATESCVRSEPSKSAVQDSSAKLDKIFVRDMIGAEVPYLESFIGPAMKIEKGYIPHKYYGEVGDANGSLETRTYKIDNCEVRVLADGTKIKGLGLTINPTCQFDLSNLSGVEHLPSLNGMTFGQFDNMSNNSFFVADCLGSCGNCCLEFVYDIWNSGHANDFLTISVSGNMNFQGKLLDASELWESQIKAGSGSAYVENATYNCDHKYDKEAHVDFRNVPIEAIWITDGSIDQRSSQAPGSCGR